MGNFILNQLAQPKGFAKHKNGKSHPVFEKKGITEDQMNISVKGNNDTIEVGTKKPTGGMKGNQESDIKIPLDEALSKQRDPSMKILPIKSETQKLLRCGSVSIQSQYGKSLDLRRF